MAVVFTGNSQTIEMEKQIVKSLYDKYLSGSNAIGSKTNARIALIGPSVSSDTARIFKTFSPPREFSDVERTISSLSLPSNRKDYLSDAIAVKAIQLFGESATRSTSSKDRPRFLYIFVDKLTTTPSAALQSRTIPNSMIDNLKDNDITPIFIAFDQNDYKNLKERFSKDKTIMVDPDTKDDSVLKNIVDMLIPGNQNNCFSSFLSLQNQ